VRLLPEWSEPEGSPTLTQLVENRRRWSEMSGFSGLPGCGQCFVESLTFIVGEIVILIVDNQVHDRAFRQRGGLVEHKATLFDTSS